MGAGWGRKERGGRNLLNRENNENKQEVVTSPKQCKHSIHAIQKQYIIQLLLLLIVVAVFFNQQSPIPNHYFCPNYVFIP